MDIRQAQLLIKDTFENSFDKRRYIYFVNNLLNNIEDATFVYKGNKIRDAYKDYIHSLERIGKYSDGSKTIDVLIVTLRKDTSLDRARTMQRNFIAWYLVNSESAIMKDGAIVAFISPSENDWRFSLIKMEYRFEKSETWSMKVKEEFTPAKRWSFLVGQNEKSHTAQKQLEKILANDEHSPTFGDLEKAFDIETVSKEFFEKYRELFLHIKEELDKVVKNDSKIKADFIAHDIDTVNFVKNLLGQIVFLYFIQKKGWLGVRRDNKWGAGSKQFLRELFEKRHANYNNFFNDILEPLFYEALRIDRSHDDGYFSQFDCKIPFLNGGLFDPIGNYDWVNTDIVLPDKLFSNFIKTKEGDIGNGMLDVFDRYNFTVKEDEPLEIEVAIDPELLGKVYEKFNAIRPDNFDEYKGALKSGSKGDENKFNKKFGVYYTPRNIIHYMCQQSLIIYLLTELENKVTKEELQTLVHFGERVGENEARVEREGRETKSYYYKIRKNAELIDEKLMEITICDPAVGSGAFPVGMMNEIIKARIVLSIFLKGSDRTAYDFKHNCIEQSLYGVDIDPGAVEITKLRLWLSLVVDEDDIKNIKPLPNLDYKVVCGNSLLGVEKNIFNTPLFLELEELKPLYFNETNSNKKQEYKKQIDELIIEITNGHKEFDFKVYFSEVFHNKSGFDIVIANPPYVKESTNKSAFDGLRTSECYQGKMDLWYLFGSKGLNIIKQHGIMSFIATNNWTSNDGASKFRNKVIRNGRLIYFIDFANYKVFTAGIQTMIYLMVRDDEPSQYQLNYGKLLDDNADSTIISNFLSSNVEVLTPHFKKYSVDFNRRNYVDAYIKFIHPTINRVLDKITKEGSFYLADNEIFSGIDVMQDFVSKASAEKLGGKYDVGTGVFVISNKEKEGRPWNRKELEIIKPYYTTREISRYYANLRNTFWVLYTGTQTNRSIKKFPNIKKHFDQFKKIITSVNKPYGLHRAREERIFLGDKILSVRKCSQPSFAYVDFPCYVARSFLILKSNRINLKFLLGILNSKLIKFWLFEKGKLQGNLFQVDKVPLQAIPIKIGQNEKKNKVIELVEKIIIITKRDEYIEKSTEQADVKNLESKIDQLVYQLYDLTLEQIKIVEGNT